MLVLIDMVENNKVSAIRSEIVNLSKFNLDISVK